MGCCKHALRAGLVLLAVMICSSLVCAKEKTDATRHRITYLPESSYLLPKRNRELGVLYQGATERVRKFMDLVMKGHSVTMTFLGGSVTEGTGLVPGSAPWPEWLLKLLHQSFDGSKIKLVNGARGATNSEYMAVCLQEHAPMDTDIFFVEYAFNDAFHALPRFDNPRRRPFEKMLRQLLNYPKRPAVIILNFYPWKNFLPTGGIDSAVYYHDCEADFTELGSYYHMPVLSTKAAAYHLLLDNKLPGFRTDNLIGMPGEGMRSDAFYIPDGVHPGGFSGHRVMAELAHHYLVKVARSLQRQPFDVVKEGPLLEAPLPRPMIKDNWETAGSMCYFLDKLKALVADSKGFNWVDEAREGQRPRWGMVGLNVGDYLTLKVDLSKVNPLAHKPGSQAAMSMTLGMLHSYDNMGVARISCVDGCTCEPVVHNCTWNTHVSLTSHVRLDIKADVPKETKKMVVPLSMSASMLALRSSGTGSNSSSISSAAATEMEVPDMSKCHCSIKVEITPETSGHGKHKIKMQGVVVVPDAGEQVNLNTQSSEYLTDADFIKQKKAGTLFGDKHAIARLLDLGKEAKDYFPPPPNNPQDVKAFAH